MVQRGIFVYNENDDVQVVGLPYVAQHLAMFVLLPKQKFALEKVEKALDASAFLDLITNTYPTEVLVSNCFCNSHIFIVREVILLGGTASFSSGAGFPSERRADSAGNG